MIFVCPLDLNENKKIQSMVRLDFYMALLIIKQPLNYRYFIQCHAKKNL